MIPYQRWRCAPQDRFAGVPRTAQHLNWRFGECPQLRCERFQIARAGRIVRYLVLCACEPVELRQESSSTRWRLTTTGTYGVRSSPMRADVSSGRRRA